MDEVERIQHLISVFTVHRQAGLGDHVVSRSQDHYRTRSSSELQIHILYKEVILTSKIWINCHCHRSYSRECHVIFYLLYCLYIILVFECPPQEGYMAASVGRPSAIPTAELGYITDECINRSVEDRHRPFSSMQYRWLSIIHGKSKLIFYHGIAEIFFRAYQNFLYEISPLS